MDGARHFVGNGLVLCSPVRRVVRCLNSLGAYQIALARIRGVFHFGFFDRVGDNHPLIMLWDCFGIILRASFDGGNGNFRPLRQRGPDGLIVSRIFGNSNRVREARRVKAVISQIGIRYSTLPAVHRLVQREFDALHVIGPFNRLGAIAPSLGGFGGSRVPCVGVLDCDSGSLADCASYCLVRRYCAI